MAATILAVSEDEAFATMLQEGLEGLGHYHVVIAHSGDDARRVVQSRRVDLLIVDTNLEQYAPAQLVADIRTVRPQTRLMWMPFLGQELPPELTEIDAQGLLNKPFFIEDLYRRIESALGHPVEDAPPEIPGVPVTGPLGGAATRVPLGMPESVTPAVVTPEPISMLSATVVEAVPLAAPIPDESVSPADAMPPFAPEPPVSSTTAPIVEPTLPAAAEPPASRMIVPPAAAAPAAGAPRNNAGTKRPAITPEPPAAAPADRPRRVVLGSDRTAPATPSRGAESPSVRPPAMTGTLSSRLAGSRPAESVDNPLEARLKVLAQGLNAEAALVLDREGRVVAWTGFVHRRYAPELAAAVAAEFAASDRIAGLLHERDGRFPTHIHEGKDYLLFSMFMWESDLILSVAVRADVPLGTVRYQVRQAALELSRHVRK